jgi:uncharacterized membrane protein
METLSIWVITILLIIINLVLFIIKTKSMELTFVHFVVMVFTFGIGALFVFGFEPVIAVFLMMFSIITFIGNILMIKV